MPVCKSLQCSNINIFRLLRYLAICVVLLHLERLVGVCVVMSDPRGSMETARSLRVHGLGLGVLCAELSDVQKHLLKPRKKKLKGNTLEALRLSRMSGRGDVLRRIGHFLGRWAYLVESVQDLHGC